MIPFSMMQANVAPAAPPSNTVTWQDLTGFTDNGGGTVATNATGYFKQARTVQTIDSGDGYFEFPVGNAGKLAIVGLHSGALPDTSSRTYNLAVSIDRTSTGTLSWTQDGNYVSEISTTIADDDVIRVQISGGLFQIVFKGKLVGSYKPANLTYPYYLLVSGQAEPLYDPIIFASVKCVALTAAVNATYENIVGGTDNGDGSITFAAGSPYSHWASTVQKITSGDGYVEFVNDAVGYTSRFTLDQGAAADPNGATTTLAFWITNGPTYNAEFRKDGVYTGEGGGAVAAGDLLRLQFCGGECVGLKNGAIIGRASITLAYPYFALVNETQDGVLPRTMSVKVAQY